MASSSLPSHCFFLVALFLLSATAYGQLSESFYAGTCPSLGDIVRTEVSSTLSSDKRMGASLLRLFFHDCFVQGCDASILLANVTDTERGAGPNASLRGFDVIDRIKAKVEDATNCPGVVSCADILALATREAVVQLNGTSWTLLLGRRDSATAASKAQAETDLPGPDFTLSQLADKFGKKGFTRNELVALSGAHTIGFAQCAFMDASQARQADCPAGRLSPGTTPLDMLTSAEPFDNKYYVNLMNKKGLLHSDNELITDRNLKLLVKQYSSNAGLFATDFAAVMKKLSELGVLTGNQGRVRLDCKKVN